MIMIVSWSISPQNQRLAIDWPGQQVLDLNQLPTWSDYVEVRGTDPRLLGPVPEEADADEGNQDDRRRGEKSFVAGLEGHDGV
jgi:hypothetical protein